MQYTAASALKRANRTSEGHVSRYISAFVLTMYHTMYQSQMMVQIMSGQQAGGQCPPAQAHTLHMNGVNALHQTDFAQCGQDIPGHGRHRTLQVHVKIFSI